ncbi:MAG: CinA family nicotinamide mononucleotide deamidase-related protein [Planctomycetaceae bacterium]
MSAEIIAVGTELTTGAKLDTNSQWLSLELAAAGISVQSHTTVADDLAANVALLRAAVDRSDVVLITGGLGPTLDDLTRDALSALAASPLVLHEPSLEAIRQMFARRNRDMPERNVVQAMLPAGAEPLPNQNGTAPGVFLTLPRAGRIPCQIAALPGVPSEMKPMFLEQVVPRLIAAGGATGVIRHARINCFGPGESAAEQMLGDVTARGRDPEVGITVHEATITLRIVAHADTPDEAQRKIDETKVVIHARMGDTAFGEEDDELEHVVLRRLSQLGQTLATAECGTLGLVAHRLAAAGQPNGPFCGGIVAANARNGARQLGLADAAFSPTDDIRAVAERLALACRERYTTDFGLATSEVFDRTNAEASASRPALYLALADFRGVSSHELNLAGDQAIQRSRAAKALLNLLRLKLLSSAVAQSAQAR